MNTAWIYWVACPNCGKVFTNPPNDKKTLAEIEPVRVIDPAMGTGAFLGNPPYGENGR